MRSHKKSLSRNFNAMDLEVLCRNRFYGPLVVAYNYTAQPTVLGSFPSCELMLIQQINGQSNQKGKNWR